MKNKHVKSFNELNENKNLNISDVSESKKKYDIHDLFIEFSKSKRKHLQEIRNLLTKVDDERYENELKSYISYLSKIPANLMKNDNNEYMGMVDWD